MKTFRASIPAVACLFALFATSASRLNAHAVSGTMSASNPTAMLLQSHTYDLDTLIRIQTSGSHSSIAADSPATAASFAVGDTYQPAATPGTGGTNVVLPSVSGSVSWNTYPLTLSINMPGNIPSLFEDQLFELSANVVDPTMLYENYNSAARTYKWEVSSNGSDWRTIGSASGDSALYTSGTENPLSINIIPSLAGLYYRATADVGPTIRNNDPVTLVSNTIRLPAIRHSYVARPTAMALDNTSGVLYIADPMTNAIWKISNGNKASILAGSVTRQSGTLDATGTNALFNAPSGIALHNGKVYVADTGNHAIRVIDADGAVTTLAGAPGQSGYTEASGTNAHFSYPRAITADNAGNLYVADTGNTIIRKVTPAGVTSHVAGSRYVSNIGSIKNIDISSTYADVTDTANFTCISSINFTPTGTSLGMIAFSSISGSSTSSSFMLTDVTLAPMPIDIFGNYTTSIRLIGGSKLSLAGNIFNNSGTSASGETGDGSAPYYFISPHGLAVSSDGATLWAANTGSDVICKISLADGSITEQAIVLQNPWISTPGLNPSPVNDPTPIRLPAGIRFASNGDLYIADMGNSRIVKFTPATGKGSLVSGAVPSRYDADRSYYHGYNNGNHNQAAFNFPTDLTINNAGTIYVADTDNAAIRTIISGTVNTLVLQMLQTSPTTAPTGTSSTGNSSGGGAPSAWYLFAFAALAASRLRRK